MDKPIAILHALQDFVRIHQADDFHIHIPLSNKIQRES